MRMITPIDILKKHFCNKRIKAFGYGTESENFTRQEAIGKKITHINFGNEEDEAGLLFWFEDITDPIFIGCDEKLELE